MKVIRPLRSPWLLFLGAGLALAGCGERQTGPVRVAAIGPDPALANPNREPLTPAASLLLEAVAQGLVRFDAAGEIEPALAQSWLVSDDGRRYTFRIQRTTWADGTPVTARQVVERLRAATARASRNPLRPILGSIEEIEAMTDRVLEIRLRSPRANFLQLLAQPELAIMRGSVGTGPYRVTGQEEGWVRLAQPVPEDEEEAANAEPTTEILLSGGSAGQAIARFQAGLLDFVTGGTIGDLPVLSAAEMPEDRVALDPAAGLFGLAFNSAEGALAQVEVRQALSMAIDRAAIGDRFSEAFQARSSLVPGGVDELPSPAQPDWTALPIEQRRARAAAAIAEAAGATPLRLRVAVPDGPGYRIVFAHIRRDWRFIGVEAVRVPAGAPAELRLIDQVAPAELASWYLRPFICGQSAVCDPVASQALEGARVAPTMAERQALLAQADAALTGIAAFIPLGSPLRWSLLSERMNGFRANPFARHTPTELLERRD